MNCRDRIQQLRRVPANQLRSNPRNWRRHPPHQRDVLQGLLAEIGYAGALLARELPDGTLELIDGHLRAETTPDMDVPVLVVDLDETEAVKLLALYDPSSALAGADKDVLATFLPDIQTQSEAVRVLLDQMLDADDEPPEQSTPELDVPETFQVVVECRDEAEQQSLFERLTAEGYDCRLLNL
jgi:hypothetical protein